MIKLTIGIVTYNNPVCFPELINSLSIAYSLLDPQFSSEIITDLVVIDNNKAINNKYVVNSLAKYIDNIPFIVHRSDGTASGGRNKILEVAQGDIICFIDDDCTLPLNYFQQLYPHFSILMSSTQAIGVAPKIIRERNLQDKLDNGLIQAGFDHYFSFDNNPGLSERFSKVRWAPTANIIVKKKAIKHRFSRLQNIRVGGEDVIWGWQNTEKGKYFITSKALFINHTSYSLQKNSLPNIIGKAIEYGKAEAYMSKFFEKKFSERRKAKDIFKDIFLIICFRIKYSLTGIDSFRETDIAKNITAAYTVGNLKYSLFNYHKWPKRISLSSISQDSI